MVLKANRQLIISIEHSHSFLLIISFVHGSQLRIFKKEELSARTRQKPFSQDTL